MQAVLCPVVSWRLEVLSAGFFIRPCLGLGALSRDVIWRYNPAALTDMACTILETQWILRFLLFYPVPLGIDYHSDCMLLVDVGDCIFSTDEAADCSCTE